MAALPPFGGSGGPVDGWQLTARARLVAAASDPFHHSSGAPLPDHFELCMDGNGRKFFLDHKARISTWVDPRDALIKPMTFEECVGDEMPFGWEVAWDSYVGEYFIDHINLQNQLEDPRQQWRQAQQMMLKQYLVEADLGLQQKLEALRLEEERVRQAEEEFRLMSHELYAGFSDGGFDAFGYDPSLLLDAMSLIGGAEQDDINDLHSELESAWDRVSQLRTDAATRMDEVERHREGLEILRSVDQRFDGGTNYSLADARAARQEIDSLRETLMTYEEEKKQLKAELRAIGAVAHLHDSTGNLSIHENELLLSDLAKLKQLLGEDDSEEEDLAHESESLETLSRESPARDLRPRPLAPQRQEPMSSFDDTASIASNSTLLPDYPSLLGSKLASNSSMDLHTPPPYNHARGHAMSRTFPSQELARDSERDRSKDNSVSSVSTQPPIGNDNMVAIVIDQGRLELCRVDTDVSADFPDKNLVQLLVVEQKERFPDLRQSLLDLTDHDSLDEADTATMARSTVSTSLSSVHDFSALRQKAKAAAAATVAFVGEKVPHPSESVSPRPRPVELEGSRSGSIAHANINVAVVTLPSSMRPPVLSIASHRSGTLPEDVVETESSVTKHEVAEADVAHEAVHVTLSPQFRTPNAPTSSSPMTAPTSNSRTNPNASVSPVPNKQLPPPPMVSDLRYVAPVKVNAPMSSTPLGLATFGENTIIEFPPEPVTCFQENTAVLQQFPADIHPAAMSMSTDFTYNPNDIDDGEDSPPSLEDILDPEDDFDDDIDDKKVMDAKAKLSDDHMRHDSPLAITKSTNSNHTAAVHEKHTAVPLQHRRSLMAKEEQAAFRKGKTDNAGASTTDRDQLASAYVSPPLHGSISPEFRNRRNSLELQNYKRGTGSDPAPGPAKTSTGGLPQKLAPPAPEGPSQRTGLVFELDLQAAKLRAKDSKVEIAQLKRLKHDMRRTLSTALSESQNGHSTSKAILQLPSWFFDPRVQSLLGVGPGDRDEAEDVSAQVTMSPPTDSRGPARLTRGEISRRKSIKSLAMLQKQQEQDPDALTFRQKMAFFTAGHLEIPASLLAE